MIVKEALANGRLAAQDDVAIATALRQPWADVVLSGAVTVDQLHSNLRALNLALTALDSRRAARFCRTAGRLLVDARVPALGVKAVRS